MGWKNHKAGCNAVKKARLRLEQTERELRRDIIVRLVWQSNFFGVCRQFDDWKTARCELIEKMLAHSFNNRSAVQALLDHELDMVRLRPTELDLVPLFYLRLGQDQEAYDFIKWRVKNASDGRYRRWGWSGRSRSLVYHTGADVLEPPNDWEHPTFWVRKSRYLISPPDLADQDFGFQHFPAVLLIKIRLFLDLVAMQNVTHAFQGFIPQEIVVEIRRSVVSTCSPLASRQGILFGTQGKSALAAVKKQIKDVALTIGKRDPLFLRRLLGESISPQARFDGKVLPDDLDYWCHRQCWEETPGAIDILRGVWEVVERITRAMERNPVPPTANQRPVPTIHIQL